MLKQRIQWAIDNLLAYIEWSGEEDVHIRDLHYFVLSADGDSRVPRKEKGTVVYDIYDEQRMNPKTGKMTTINWYQAILCGALKEARLKHMIDFNLIVDEKNDKIIIGLHNYRYINEDDNDRRKTLQDLIREGIPLNGRRMKAEVESIEYDTETSGYISVWANNMKDWEDFTENVDITINFQTEQFNNQDYHLAVGIEKTGYGRELEKICRKHGADFMQFSGQPSVTSECLIYQLAQMDENRPVGLFYIVDLDPAGYQMPTAFINNLNIMTRDIDIMYPDRRHFLKVVGLTFEQATELNLPPSFDLFLGKNYGRAKIETFYRQTGMDDSNRVAIELNALKRDYIYKLLEDALTEYSHLDIDIKNNDDFQDKINPIKDMTIEDLDLSHFEDDYNEIYEDHQELVEEVKEYQESIRERHDEIDNRLYAIKNVIQEYIKEEFENNRND